MTEEPIAPIDEEIAARARLYWIEEGEPEGRAEEHWRRAEEILQSERRGSGDLTGSTPPGSTEATS